MGSAWPQRKSANPIDVGRRNCCRLAIFFAFAAVAPNVPEAPKAVASILGFVGRLISPFGRLTSIVDSMLVFAVAGAVGASRTAILLRYLLLGATMIPCAVLGFFLKAPWGLLPIGWGFVVAISMSRRWAWIEDDRELSMLNRRYTGSHLRIGFGQDLRDEALLSFMSMFFLIPLALQQAQAWSSALDAPLFTIRGRVALIDWVGFYGTELAKAVPFVDWAEIYGIGGNAPIKVESDPARHVVFATRVLVDLVFLAALLQAIGISTRNSRQKELFFGEPQALDRLDPFIEPREFRKLLLARNDGRIAVNPDAIAKFPKYDPVRLGELCDEPSHPEIYLAARALSARDGGANSEALHDTLLERSLIKKPDPAGLKEVITAIRTAGPKRLAYELGQSRIGLNGKAPLNDLRLEVTRLLIEAPRTDERTEALIAVLQGSDRDAIYPVRKMALNALQPEASAGNQKARDCIQYVAAQDNAANLRRDAANILAALATGGGGAPPNGS